jgi:hypothetical protein
MRENERGERRRGWEWGRESTRARAWRVRMGEER